VANLRSANIGVSAPELNGQEDHEEGVGAQIGRVGEVGVEGWGAYLVLQQSQPWCLPADYGDEAVAQRIAPCGQSTGVCSWQGTC
jgi:hypothetical protein